MDRKHGEEGCCAICTINGQPNWIKRRKGNFVLTDKLKNTMMFQGETGFKIIKSFCHRNERPLAESQRKLRGSKAGNWVCEDIFERNICFNKNVPGHFVAKVYLRFPCLFRIKCIGEN